MPDEELDKLVLYLSTLGVRPQRVWQTGIDDQNALQGRDLFTSIGCESCHTDTMQTSAFHPLAEVRDPHHAYLHDGRARSIDEAIRWHGGESQDSNDEYQALSVGQR